MQEYAYTYSTEEPPDSVKQIPFFQAVSSEALSELLKHTTILDCEPGDRVTSEGEQDNSLLFLLKGKVRVLVDGTSVASAWESGDMLGELSLLNHTGRTATVTAQDHVYCLKVDPKFVDDLPAEEAIAFHAAMYRFIARLLAERLTKTSDKLAIAEKRLAELGG
ncbi:MAG: Crp/Fnr family transcriptional regulator [Verrucomicrobiales bacterium]